MDYKEREVDRDTFDHIRSYYIEECLKRAMELLDTMEQYGEDPRYAQLAATYSNNIAGLIYLGVRKKELENEGKDFTCYYAPVSDDNRAPQLRLDVAEEMYEQAKQSQDDPSVDGMFV